MRGHNGRLLGDIGPAEEFVQDAAIFPEVAALAALIASPAWHAVASQPCPADLRRLLDAAAHALGCSGAVGAPPTRS